MTGRIKAGNTCMIHWGGGRIDRDAGHMLTNIRTKE